MSAASRAQAAAVLSLALIARLAIAQYATQHQERFDYPDSRRYAQVARNFAQGNGPIASEHDRTGTDPLYPILLSPAWAFQSATLYSVYDWARLVNIMLGMLGVMAVMRFGRELGGQAGEVAAGLICALDPILLFSHALPLTEAPFTGLFWAGAYAAWRCTRRPSPLWGIAAGAAFGAAVLIRSSGLPLALLLPLVIVWRGKGRPVHRMIVALLTWAALGICIAPAAIRNHRLLGHWAPVRTGMGATLLESLGPWADGGPGMEKVHWPPTPPGANEFERDTLFRDTAVAWAKENPGRVLALALAKVTRTWSPAPHAPGCTGAVFAWIGWASALPEYILAVVGVAILIVGRRGAADPAAKRVDRTAAILLTAPALYFTLLHAVFVGSVRYRVPLMPGLFVLAAVALARWNSRRRMAPRPPSRSSTACR